ncbi:MAG: glycosyltransferase family 2 protein [Selenomonadaceae bacterium]|nr:glycosyltransferase family 2 protein [Selenomonadaceae bacterium]
MSQKNLPAVSLVAPTYNVEKYVEQFLDSVLNQTFDDYELIIIDDCSTDRSAELVESYIDRFDGRMRLIKRDRNSGGDAIPKNTGIALSRGKYLLILDSDDMISKTALEELYRIAEDTGADVLHAERYLTTDADVIDESTPLETKTSESVEKFVVEPTEVTDDLAERMKLYVRSKFFWFHWSKFFRRDFIVGNRIELPNLPASSDLVFSFKCLCLAKKYVRIPTVFNVYRTRGGSMTRQNLSPESYIKKWAAILIDGLNEMEHFMDEQTFFVENPKYRFMVRDYYIQQAFHWTDRLYRKVSPAAIDRIVQREFERHGGASIALQSYLFSFANLYRAQLVETRRQLGQLKRSVGNGDH